ncbi:hypothetical protein CV717_28980 [Bacillus cereus]|nr:hypothetical protein CV717_28980 [Bacillus cereus]
MADTLQSEFWAKLGESEPGKVESVLSKTVGGSTDNSGSNPPGSDTVLSDQGRGNEDLSGEDQEAVEAEERAMWLADIDAREIHDVHTTTAAYRRAFALFDPSETEVQLLEHFEYVDADYQRFKRF